MRLRSWNLIWFILLLVTGLVSLHYVVFSKRDSLKGTKRTNEIPSGASAENKQPASKDKHPSEVSIQQSSPHKIKSNPEQKQPRSEETYFVRRNARVTPLDFVFNVRGPSCRTGNASPFLVILVLSLHDHVAERNAVRETWGSVVKTKSWGKHPLAANTLIVFLLGNPNNASKSEQIQKENDEFHDLVEANFVDSYYNLTYKVLMGYKWVKQFCPSAQFVAKVDEDTFLNMPLLINILGTLKLHNKVLGPYFPSAPVMRNGKYRVEKENYPLNTYPPHVKGNFYIMPTSLAFSVLQTAEFMPYVCMEDAHVTGVLIKVIGGSHLGVSTSAYLPFQYTPPEVCGFMRPFKLAAQQVTPERAKSIWKTIIGETQC